MPRIADIPSGWQSLGMKRSLLALALALPFALWGCSYSYDIKAVVIHGHLSFIVDPNSAHRVSCFNSIDVIASGDARAKSVPGDDISRVEYGTFWHQRMDHQCVDEFPIRYGQTLKGKRSPLGQAPDSVAAKPLRIGVVYEVTTVTGATGYGGGAFKIMPNLTVVNVSPPPLSEANDLLEPVAGTGS